MRLGIVSDIHGNAAALQRAFDLMGPVDELCSLGDNINQSQFSNAVVKLLRDRNVLTIRGNHEEVFFGPQGSRARAAPWIEVDLMSWLAQRPASLELQLCGRKLLLVHSTAWEPCGEYVTALSSSFKRFGDAPADVVFYGHTHQPVVQRIGRTLVVNPGSVGEGRPESHGYVSSCAVFDVVSEEVCFHDFLA